MDDDDHYHPETNIWDCGDTGDHCMVGFNFEPKGDCLPGLICVLADPYHGDMGQCQLKEQQGPTPAPAVLPPSMVVPESPATIIHTVPPAVATPAASLVTSSSSTGNTTKGGSSFVLLVVGLLGSIMIAMQVVLQRRHRVVLLRRHQYSEVDV